jgi:hypothetical protein
LAEQPQEVATVNQIEGFAARPMPSLIRERTRRDEHTSVGLLVVECSVELPDNGLTNDPTPTLTLNDPLLTSGCLDNDINSVVANRAGPPCPVAQAGVQVGHRFLKFASRQQPEIFDVIG